MSTTTRHTYPIGWHNGEYYCLCGTIFRKNLLGESPFGPVHQHLKICPARLPDDPDGAPNLDCSRPEDLEAYAEDMTHPSHLRRYARQKAGAMRLRSAGKIKQALVIERELDDLYNHLPDSMRW